MCGIVGVIKKDRISNINKQKLIKSTNRLSHRGPDESGFFIEKNFGLGHRRLKIIDLTSGQQPMLDDKSKNIIVFNGEIYNYIELRKILQKNGYDFKTSSDTEVILKSYDYWGEKCVDYFNGMWSFVICNVEKNTAFASRDRIGEKPFYYYQDDENFVFSSEIKGLLNYVKNIEIDFSFIQAYFINLNIPAPYTFYKDIFQLKPGHNLILKNKKLNIYKYWELPNVDEKDIIRDETYVLNSFEEIFLNSVKIRMRSDVNFGAFLSGGLDSSLIVSVMQRFSSKKIYSYTMGFDDPKYDERYLANLVAEKFRTIHTEDIIYQNELDNPIDLIFNYFDQPFGDSSAIPTFFVSQKAKKHTSMVLTGDGGDEVLSGYKTFKKIKLIEFFNKSPKLLNNFIKDFFSKLNNNFNSSLLKELYLFTNNLNSNFSKINLNNRINSSHLKYLNEFINDSYSEHNQFSIIDFYNDIINSSKIDDPFYQQMRLNFYNDLPNDYLVKVDRMSMANSLETRAPFLDYRLIELMAQVHKNIKLKNLQSKSILRNSSIGKNLPTEVLNAKKSGFSLPLQNFNLNYFKKNNFTDSYNNLFTQLNKMENHAKQDQSLIFSSLSLISFIQSKK